MSDDVRALLTRMAGEAPAPSGVPPRLPRRARRRRVRTISVGILASAVLAYGGFVGVGALLRPGPKVGPAATRACSTWEEVPSPHLDPARFDNRLLGVAAFSADEAWAVGDLVEPTEGGEQRSVILHWDPTGFSIPPQPDVQSLTGVSGTGPDDLWAVGFDDNRGIALHWDGAAWTEVPPADPGTRYWHLSDVDALAADDVWAVGGTATGESGGTLVEHWDGRRWSVVASPSPPPRPQTGKPYAILEAVSALAPDRVWAAGESVNVGADGPSNTLLLGWDGQGWNALETPDARVGDSPPFDNLFDVAAASSEDVWAVGSYGPQPGYGGGGDRALIVHWDGAAWALSAPPPLADDTRLSGVAAAPTGEAWAVGSSGPSGSYEPVLLRWDGTAWTEDPAPVGSGWLFDVAVSPTGAVWAVGQRGTGGTLVVRCTPG